MLSHCNDRHPRQSPTSADKRSTTYEFLSVVGLEAQHAVPLRNISRRQTYPPRPFMPSVASLPPFYPSSRNEKPLMPLAATPRSRPRSSGPWIARSGRGRGLLAGAGRSCCEREFAVAGFARENLVREVVLQDAEVYAPASGWIHPCARTDQSKTAHHEVGHDVPRQAIPAADERLVITFCDNRDAVLSTKERLPSIIRI
ncbi:hypothetical protein ISCGN_013720 [Ixodes scapularis]